MSAYIFVFGRTPQLALAELRSFFPEAIPLTSEVAIVDGFSDEQFIAGVVLARLGGTVKIARVVSEALTILSVDLVSQLIRISGDLEKRIVFGISSYHPAVLVTSKLLSEIKQALESRAYMARFVAARDNEPLSSVVVSKQNLTELVISPNNKTIVIAKTVAVQDFEEWNRRDYGRPFADPKAGMLPPKVARMAVNIAASHVIPASEPGSRGIKLDPRVKPGDDKVLLDPFCGMGTVLAEALLSGWNVIGSDQSEEVIKKARKNLEWLTGRDPVKKQGLIPQAWKLFVSDATHVSEHLATESIDAIVTEPFMGSTHLGENGKLRQSLDCARDGPDQWKTAKNILKGLEKLYIGCLKDWRGVLKPHGKVVMAIPAFRIGDKMLYVKNVIDSCENLGYTKLLGPIEYSRPHAVVRRKFYIFVKN